MKLTQLQIIKNKLDSDGVISNLWAIQQGIWRLGARIKELRDDGLNIETKYNDKEHGKNTHYYLVIS